MRIDSSRLANRSMNDPTQTTEFGLIDWIRQRERPRTSPWTKLVTGPLGGSLVAGRHLRPEPRIHEALALHEAAPLHAMIDISDGLSSDLAHILAESGGLGAVLDSAAIPIHADARELSRHDGIS